MRGGGPRTLKEEKILFSCFGAFFYSIFFFSPEARFPYYRGRDPCKVYLSLPPTRETLTRSLLHRHICVCLFNQDTISSCMIFS